MMNQINQVDKNGRRHGLWEKHYYRGESNYSKARCQYKHGKFHGPWEYFSPNGALIHKGNYNRSKAVGLWYSLNR